MSKQKKALTLPPETILQRIREAKVKEELAIPIYVSHIEQALFWSGLTEDKQKQIISKLKLLSRESEMHAKLLKTVEDIYSKSIK